MRSGRQEAQVLTRQGPLRQGLKVCEQVRPLPKYPPLHVQVREPSVLVHVACTSQPPLLVAHSLMSLQVKPLPLKPELQAQVREPAMFVQVACTLQPPFPVAHSFTSEGHKKVMHVPDKSRISTVRTSLAAGSSPAGNTAARKANRRTATCSAILEKKYTSDWSHDGHVSDHAQTRMYLTGR